jgi:hypothetical protein
MKKQKSVSELMVQAFDTPRDPRSEEYKIGVATALTFRIHGKRMICQYPLGTAAADAYLAGTEEGHRIWREEEDKEREKEEQKQAIGQ